ncbi:MAG: hypothetical protein ABJ242_04040 [Marinomonas sp.]
MNSKAISQEASPLPRKVYTIEEACTVSTLSRANIFNQIGSGKLKVVRVGGRTLVPVENLHSLISEEK